MFLAHNSVPVLVLITFSCNFYAFLKLSKNPEILRSGIPDVITSHCVLSILQVSLSELLYFRVIKEVMEGDGGRQNPSPPSFPAPEDKKKSPVQL